MTVAERITKKLTAGFDQAECQEEAQVAINAFSSHIIAAADQWNSLREMYGSYPSSVPDLPVGLIVQLTEAAADFSLLQAQLRNKRTRSVVDWDAGL